MGRLLTYYLLLASLPVATGCKDISGPPTPRRQIAIPADAPEQIRTALKSLNADDPLQRAYGARLLGSSTDPTAVTFLLDVLQDENALVRARGAESLGRIGDEVAIDPLVALLQDGTEDRDVRTASAKALGCLNAGQAVDPLIAALTDTVWHVRYQAAVALGQIGAASAEQALTDVARYEDNVFVRSAAKESLQKLASRTDDANS